MRQEMVLRQLLGGIEHGGDHLAVLPLVPRPGEQRIEVQHLVQQEIDVAAVDQGHGGHLREEA